MSTENGYNRDYPFPIDDEAYNEFLATVEQEGMGAFKDIPTVHIEQMELTHSAERHIISETDWNDPRPRFNLGVDEYEAGPEHPVGPR